MWVSWDWPPQNLLHLLDMNCELANEWQWWLFLRKWISEAGIATEILLKLKRKRKCWRGDLHHAKSIVRYKCHGALLSDIRGCLWYFHSGVRTHVKRVQTLNLPSIKVCFQYLNVEPWDAHQNKFMYCQNLLIWTVPELNIFAVWRSSLKPGSLGVSFWWADTAGRRRGGLRGPRQEADGYNSLIFIFPFGFTTSIPHFAIICWLCHKGYFFLI